MSRTTTARDTLAALTAGRTLDEPQARALMDATMAGELSDAQFGAVFMLLHARGETIDELVGMARSMRAHAVGVEATPDVIDTCGTGGDGSGSFNVSTTAALVAAGAGVRVAKHGNRAVSSRCGSADVLEALGGSLETTPADVNESLSRAGFAFLHAPSFHPAMRHAAGPRRQLGTRTAFNLLGPIVNPAGVRRQVLGVSDAGSAERIAQVLHVLGVERALVVHGHDGLDEVTVTGPTRIYDVTSDGVWSSSTTPEQLGVPTRAVGAIPGGDIARNAELVRGVLAGTEHGAARDVVLVNAAAALLVAGRVDTLADGVPVAARSIDDGSALRSLERWIEHRRAQVVA